MLMKASLLLQHDQVKKQRESISFVDLLKSDVPSQPPSNLNLSPYSTPPTHRQMICPWISLHHHQRRRSLVGESQQKQYENELNQILLLHQSSHQNPQRSQAKALPRGLRGRRGMIFSPTHLRILHHPDHCPRSTS